MTTKPKPRKLPPPTGALAGMAAWTDQDDQALRASWGPGGIAAARAALPDRSVVALCHRARRLGLSRRRRWTPKDDAQLRALWNGDHDLEQIAARCGRSPATTYWRAQKIGLPLGCPDGWEHVTTACRRTGYDLSQLRRLLAADGATVRVAITKRDVRNGQTRRTHIVPIREVDAAVAAWVEEEPVHVAARRLGLGGEALARRLRALGLEKPRRGKAHWRVTQEQAEAAAAIPVVTGNTRRGPRGRFARAPHSSSFGGLG